MTTILLFLVFRGILHTDDIENYLILIVQVIEIVGTNIYLKKEERKDYLIIKILNIVLIIFAIYLGLSIFSK